MLSSLFGSKSIERILLFLLVNETCCASEVQRALPISLTRLQSSIHKLEKAGILLYEITGKKKLFRFNQDYPLHHELKALLKTAFVHLSAEEKRNLFFRRAEWQLPAKDQFKYNKRIAACLNSFWQRLEKVHLVSIQTQSAGQAYGHVLVKKEKSEKLLFIEKGQWVHQANQEIDFSKTLRWTIDYSAGVIALEHLHYGADRPVFLFHLAPTGSKSLQSIDSHVCLNDCYFGRIEFNDSHIRFLWRIIGPRKNEVLYHIYSF